LGAALGLSFSMSNIGSYVSKLGNSGNTPAINLPQNVNTNTTSKLLEISIIPNTKRVSFSDSVQLSTYPDIPKLVQNAMDDKLLSTSITSSKSPSTTFSLFS